MSQPILPDVPGHVPFRRARWHTHAAFGGVQAARPFLDAGLQRGERTAVRSLLLPVHSARQAFPAIRRARGCPLCSSSPWHLRTLLYGIAVPVLR